MRWVLVLAIFLGGCLGGGSDSPGTRDPGPTTGPTGGPDPGPDEPAFAPMLLAFGYSDCAGVMAQPAIALDAAQSVLPDGYAPMQVEGAQGPEAMAEYIWLDCGGFSTATGVINETVYGHVAVRIEAPSNASEGGEHWYLLRMLTQDDVMKAVWTAAMYDVYTGVFNVSSSVPAPLPSLERTVALGDYSIQAIETAQADGVEGTRAYYTEVEAGRLEWTGSVDLAAQSGVGQMEVAGDDPLDGEWAAAQEVLFVTGALPGNDLWLRRAA